MGSRARASLVWGLFFAAACSGPSHPVNAPVAQPADPSDPAMPALRTGATQLKDGDAMDASVVSHHVGPALETLRLDLAPHDCGPAYGQDSDVEITVALGPGRGRGHGVVRPQTGAGAHLDVLVARPRDQVGLPITGDAIFAATGCRTVGVRHPLKVVPADPQLPIAWANELARSFGQGRDWRTQRDAWHAFARNRMLQLGGTEPPDRSAPAAPDPDRLASLMATTTGLDALQEALQSDRGLFRAIQNARPTIELATLHGPALSPHPWGEMIRALGRAAPAEPLAAATPAEFYYARFASVSGLFRVLDQADAWAVPIVSLLDGRSEQRGLAERYQTQLGLERSELARAFGDKVVAELAVIGSDPYLGEGSDLTVLFRLKARPVFDATLAAALRKHGEAHGGVTTTALSHHGTAITASRTVDAAVRQYRAQLGELDVVSNSLAAIQRVLDTQGGRHPSLLAEPDFQYALARGADVPADVLGFLGDRFVAQVIGPGQKILEARRQLALAELATPAYAALLYGWLYGESPKSSDELIASGLLGKGELVHHDGAAIAWRPGDAPTSSWGAPSAMTPLLDLPPVVTVSAEERDAYARFAQTYEAYWRGYIDPIAIRVALTRDAFTIDTRVLPLIDVSEYRKLAMLVGDARVTAPPIDRGARAVFGLGELAVREAGSGLRYLMNGMSELSFIGDWVAVGVEDRPQVAAAVLAEHEVAQRPDPDLSHYRRDRSALIHLPIYAALGIRDRVKAAAFIIGLRKLAEEAVPGVLTWGEVSRAGDVAIVRVAAKDDTLGGITLYYAFVKGAFVASLDEHTIHRQIDAMLAGHGPSGASTVPGASQLVLDAAGASAGPLWRVAAWLLDAPARAAGDRSRATAEVLLYGAPELAGDPARTRELALRVFGAIPLSADGRPFERGPEGLRDPVRGSAFAPAWPELPVAGSPIASLLAAIARARCEISFDDEPAAGKRGEQSLHLKLTLGVRQ